MHILKAKATNYKSILVPLHQQKPSAEATKLGMNTDAMMKMIDDFHLSWRLILASRINVLTKVCALPDQEHGMHNGYEVGKGQFKKYISHRVLHKPSNRKAPIIN